MVFSALLAEKDCIVDNRKVREFIDSLFSARPENRIISLDSGHAIQFEKTQEVASAIANFINCKFHQDCLKWERMAGNLRNGAKRFESKKKAP